MNNKIKEILDFIKRQIEKETLSYEPDVELSKEEAKLLLDYITNLQESEAYYYGQYKDYKSRIDKAIEYIKEQYKWIEESDKRWQPVLDNKKILNILNGKE